jgi:sugar phosphate isomerase/epimerase
MELARAVGCRSITIQPGSLDTNPVLEESLVLLEQRAPVIGEMARKRGIALGMEGHQGSILENVRTGLALVRKLYPLAGVTYDPSHYVMQGYSLEETKPLLDYAVQVHFRNASRGNMQANMQDGEIDIAQFAGLLKEKNYNGSIAIEYFSGFDADCANTLAIKARLENLLK